jgi:hypothetical protein
VPVREVFLLLFLQKKKALLRACLRSRPGESEWPWPAVMIEHRSAGDRRRIPARAGLSNRLLLPARPPPGPIPAGQHPPPRHKARGTRAPHHMPAVVPHIPGVHHIPFPVAGLPRQPLRRRAGRDGLQPRLRQRRHASRLSQHRTSRERHSQDNERQQACRTARKPARRRQAFAMGADRRQPALGALSSSGLAVSATKARPRRRWREIARPSSPAPNTAIVPGSGTVQIRL